MQRNTRTRTNKTEQNKKIVHLDAVKIDCTTILCDECQDLNASCYYPPTKEFHKTHNEKSDIDPKTCSRIKGTKCGSSFETTKPESNTHTSPSWKLFTLTPSRSTARRFCVTNAKTWMRMYSNTSLEPYRCPWQYCVLWIRTNPTNHTINTKFIFNTLVKRLVQNKFNTTTKMNNKKQIEQNYTRDHVTRQILEIKNK